MRWLPVAAAGGDSEKRTWRPYLCFKNDWRRAGNKLHEDFDLFSLADVDTAWDNFVQLRYQQSVSLSGKAEGITVSPLNAGHMIGGALWKITKDSEEIVYAVDYNHAQDRHLDGTVLVDLPRPNILITDAYTALDPPMTGGRKAREGRLD